MKSLVFCLILLLSNIALATGKVMIEPNYNNTTGVSGMKGGFVLWQKLFSSPVFLDGFAGMGMDPEKDAKQWTSLKLGLGIQFKSSFQFSVGQAVNHSGANKSRQDITYMKMSYDLW